MKTYRSKIDWWLILLILGIFGYPIVEGVLTKQYGLSITMISILFFMFWMFSKIKYIIEGTMLKVWWIKIDIHSIKRIYKTNNPLSSPALSLDRIAIVYNTYDEVLISPKLKKEFVDDLLKINPTIQIDL
ncbi:PH domain-containing protein [Flavobacterium filum]|uniref:PH domain-containing protein n=1 Tax=Flavobacterium filum TaxID=370974 RepID=UPI000685D5BD|nr:PH domain-containing protein [Flavobacterium filum]